jgi:hypothetical protein
MQYADDDQLIGSVGVVQSVWAVEGHSQAGCEHLTQGADGRGLLKRLEFIFDGIEKTSRRGFRGFKRDVGPKLGQVVFGCVG